MLKINYFKIRCRTQYVCCCYASSSSRDSLSTKFSICLYYYYYLVPRLLIDCLCEFINSVKDHQNMVNAFQIATKCFICSSNCKRSHGHALNWQITHKKDDHLFCRFETNKIVTLSYRKWNVRCVCFQLASLVEMKFGNDSRDQTIIVFRRDN